MKTICPYCNKKFEFIKIKEIEILKLLKKKELSIAEIQRNTKIKRSTLIYYLQHLEVKGLIKKNRIKFGKTGRPTMIKLK